MLQHFELRRVSSTFFTLSDRKLRLISCAIERATQCFLAELEKESLDIAESWADGKEPSYKQLRRYINCGWWMSLLAIDATRESIRIHNSDQDRRQVCYLLRDMIGNPFRPVFLPEQPYMKPTGRGGIAIRTALCPWLTDDVLSLASAAYSERMPNGTLDSARLPILADALEDAGCDSEELLQHLRGMVRCVHCLDYAGDSIKNEWCTYCGLERWLPEWWSRSDRHSTMIHSPAIHYRGCWAIDLLLGKW